MCYYRRAAADYGVWLCDSSVFYPAPHATHGPAADVHLVKMHI
jgi:hypothetical protein